MKNKEIAEIFGEIAEILEIQGVNWKPRAYQRAARSIRNLVQDVEEIYKDKGLEGLKEINGVGDDISKKIKEYLEKGKMSKHEELKKKVPQGMTELLEIKGLGVKTAKDLHEKLNVKSVNDLEEAAKKGKIRNLEGYKETTEKNILEGIEFYKQSKSSGRTPLIKVLPIAREIKRKLESLDYVEKVNVAGSIRRMKEDVHDIDMLVVTENPEKTSEYFTSLDEVKKVSSKGKKRSSIITDEGIQIDLRVFEKESYGAAMQYFTGSQQHNVKFRQIAISKGYKVNEYGVYTKKKGTKVAGKTEEGVYEKIGLNYIEPELREDKGEIEAAKKGDLPSLVNYDVKGDFHVHTNWSDGNNTIKEMADKAEELGHKYLAITDHGNQKKGIYNALDENRIKKQWKEIEKVNKKSKVRLLKGSEVDIFKDGSLSLPDKVLEKLDVVIASVHSSFKMSEKEMTERILKAMDNKNVNIIGHPTGRILHKREGYKINIERISEKALEKGFALEVNASPRIDLNDINIAKAKEKGAKISIGTDSHDKKNMQYLDVGIGQARRAWCESKDVLNDWDLTKLRKFLNRSN